MIGCDVIYISYDVTQKVGVMSFKSGCDNTQFWIVTHTGYDMINIVDMMSHILYVISYIGLL